MGTGLSRSYRIAARAAALKLAGGVPATGPAGGSSSAAAGPPLNCAGGGVDRRAGADELERHCPGGEVLHGGTSGWNPDGRRFKSASYLESAMGGGPASTRPQDGDRSSEPQYCGDLGAIGDSRERPALDSAGGGVDGDTLGMRTADSRNEGSRNSDVHTDQSRAGSTPARQQPTLSRIETLELAIEEIHYALAAGLMYDQPDMERLRLAARWAKETHDAR